MTGTELIAAERQRQIDSEGWTADHDSEHTKGELARAAQCYVNHVDLVTRGTKPSYFPNQVPIEWPWDPSWWKPSEDPIRNLVKAGALLAAEIDRLSQKQRDKEVSERIREAVKIDELRNARRIISEFNEHRL